MVADHAVDHRLRVDQHADLGFVQVEQPRGLDQFEAFVHHSGRVDADFGTHRPDRMLQCDFRGSPRHFVACGGAEWPAGRRQDDLFDRSMVAVGHRLKDRVVFGVDRQERSAGIPHRPQHHLPGANQSFLVGERHESAAANRGQGGRQAGGPGDRGHRPVGAQRGCFDHCFRSGRDGDIGAGQGIAQCRVQRGIGDYRHLGTKCYGLLGQKRDIAPGDQGFDPEPFGLRRQQFQRLGADAAGAAQDCYGARGAPRPLANFGCCVAHCHSTTPRPAANASKAATGAAVSNASTRSNRPPCPGMRVPESFTPKCRLIMLSNKSPA